MTDHPYPACHQALVETLARYGCKPERKGYKVDIERQVNREIADRFDIQAHIDDALKARSEVAKQEVKP